jgi:hypothetical protein
MLPREHFSITKTSLLILFKETIAVCKENHTKPIIYGIYWYRHYAIDDYSSPVTVSTSDSVASTGRMINE